MKTNLDKITQERDNALRERTEAVAQIQEIQMKLDAKETSSENMKKETEKLQEQISSMEKVTEDKEQGITDLQAQL